MYHYHKQGAVRQTVCFFRTKESPLNSRSFPCRFSLWFRVLGWVTEQQGKVRRAWPVRRKVAVLDRITMPNQVEKKALSLENAHTDGATVTGRAMFGYMNVA